ncbi:serine/threonine-protein kinase pim-3-like [Gouania willdenowi]|uniref:serine/threonine-protein kinase pim-3-like n=1 Tax=Gouania willdenowi TaxID=441366 RepID=UPI001054BC49|nr:serine/threonine-protein kinase pim-3-like [Gouania willdenowi]
MLMFFFSEGPIPRHFEGPLKDEDGLLTTGRGRKRKADKDNVLLSNSKKPKDYSQVYPDSPCLNETEKDCIRKREGPIPRHFEGPLKDEDRLLTTGRGRKRKAEEDNVQLSNSKKPKVVEGFQELPSCILLEDNSQVYPDSPCLDETEKDWIRKREDFEYLYKEQFLLGKGGFGSVYAGINLSDGKSIALKHIPKAKVKYCQVDNGEMKVLETLLLMKAAGNLGERCKYNPGIIELVDIVDLKDEVVIVMELPDNAMDLHNYCKMKNGEMQEQEVKVIIQQILKAAFIMHENGVFHRDIKAENVLISNTNGTPSVKIIDFGCGDWVKDVPYEQFAGTRFFAPPEFLRHKKYQAEQTTVWQIGLLLHNLYTHKPYGTKEHMKGETLFINSLSFGALEQFHQTLKSMLRKYCLEQRRDWDEGCLSSSWLCVRVFRSQLVLAQLTKCLVTPCVDHYRKSSGGVHRPMCNVLDFVLRHSNPYHCVVT